MSACVLYNITFVTSDFQHFVARHPLVCPRSRLQPYRPLYHRCRLFAEKGAVASAEACRGDWPSTAAMAVASDSKGLLYNWNLTEASSPAVIAQARSIEDVQRVLKRDTDYPSPVST
jgi:hypothetical protein